MVASTRKGGKAEGGRRTRHPLSVVVSQLTVVRPRSVFPEVVLVAQRGGEGPDAWVQHHRVPRRARHFFEDHGEIRGAPRRSRPAEWPVPADEHGRNLHRIEVREPSVSYTHLTLPT